MMKIMQKKVLCNEIWDGVRFMAVVRLLALEGAIDCDLRVHLGFYSLTYVHFPRLRKINNRGNTNHPNLEGRRWRQKPQQTRGRPNYFSGVHDKQTIILINFRQRIMNRTGLRSQTRKHSQKLDENEQVFLYSAGQQGKTLELKKLSSKASIETEAEGEAGEKGREAEERHNDFFEVLCNSQLKDFVDCEEQTECCFF